MEFRQKLFPCAIKPQLHNTEVREGRDFLDKMVDLFCDLARPVINILHLNMGNEHSMYI